MAERGGSRQHAVAGWFFGSVSVVLGLIIHAGTGHPVPAVPLLVATAALLGLAGAVVARIGVPNWALLVLAGMGQQTVHWAFAFFANPLATTLGGGHGHASAAQFTGPGLLLEGVPSQPLHVLLHVHIAAALLTFVLVQRLTTRATKPSGPGAAAYPG
ncbi:hypothetical protein [Arthrobacter sp. NPDC057009]|uniref:hypothetical protein n=1 Tax=Arthrobacter sp. NPDC057009 TaxID=3345996 RepID=UPI003642F89F